MLFGDPLSPMSLNQFTYVEDNPLTYSDPTGMRIEGEGGGGCWVCQDDPNETAMHGQGSTSAPQAWSGGSTTGTPSIWDSTAAAVASHIAHPVPPPVPPPPPAPVPAHKRGDIQGPRSIDLYLYVKDDPVNQSDLSGMTSGFDCSSIGARVAAGVIGALIAAAFIIGAIATWGVATAEAGALGFYEGAIWAGSLFVQGIAAITAGLTCAAGYGG